MAWIRPATERVELPSGNAAMLRKADPAALIMHNAGSDSVPEWLKQQLIDRFNNPTGKEKPVTAQITADTLPQYARFIDLVVRAVMVSPRIVDTPNYDADEITLADIEQADKLAIFNWAMPREELAAAESFPDKRRGSLESAQPGEGVSPATL